MPHVESACACALLAIVQCQLTMYSMVHSSFEFEEHKLWIPVHHCFPGHPKDFSSRSINVQAKIAALGFCLKTSFFSICIRLPTHQHIDQLTALQPPKNALPGQVTLSISNITLDRRLFFHGTPHGSIQRLTLDDWTRMGPPTQRTSFLPCATSSASNSPIGVLHAVGVSRDARSRRLADPRVCLPPIHNPLWRLGRVCRKGCSLVKRITTMHPEIRPLFWGQGLRLCGPAVASAEALLVSRLSLPWGSGPLIRQVAVGQFRGWTVIATPDRCRIWVSHASGHRPLCIQR